VAGESAASVLAHLLPEIRELHTLNVGLGGTVVLAVGDESSTVVKCLPAAPSQQRARAEREVAMLRAAQGPHVVGLERVLHTEDYAFIMMEHLPLPTLRDRLGDPWSAADLAATGVAVASVLARLHDSGVLFNDVKPRNLGVKAVSCGDGGERRYVSVFDFGHANTIAGTLSSRFVAGSVDYVAPEVYWAGAVSPASDVWSWGRTWHLLASGRYFQRFDNFNQLLRHGRQPLAPIASVSRVALPQELAALIDSALSVDPADRPADGSQLRNLLGDLIEDEWGGELALHTNWCVDIE
jgi:serine/threonine protein kinase